MQVQSTEVRSLVEQYRQTDEKAQRLRQDEKKRLDRKLMEKLDRRKVKVRGIFYLELDQRQHTSVI